MKLQLDFKPMKFSFKLFPYTSLRKKSSFFEFMRDDFFMRQLVARNKHRTNKKHSQKYVEEECSKRYRRKRAKQRKVSARQYTHESMYHVQFPFNIIRNIYFVSFAVVFV